MKDTRRQTRRPHFRRGSKPSWFILAQKDQTVHPDLQRFLAKRMNATIVETDSSRVIMLSQPDRVIEVIRKAAAAVPRS